MSNDKQTIYIYRGSVTGGGCSKIINDLIVFLHNQNKYNIVLISFVSSDLHIDEDENGNLIPIKRIFISSELHWRKQIATQIAEHIDKQINPVLVSFLDFNSNRFIFMSDYILRDNIFWINFDTNHPTKIINAFSTKNEATGITYETLCDAVDIIRLENPNFSKYIPGNNQHKIRSFWNTVKIPNYIPVKFEKKFNIININGLRETRKSILPLVKVLPEIIKTHKDFTLHIIGEISPLIMKELNLIIESNKEIENYISVENTVKNIHDYYSSCDFMVSTAEFEGTSNAVIEAISHELPVLCLTTSLGINETIEHNVTGFHCKNPEDMNSRIRQLMDDPQKLKKLKQNCNKFKNQLINPVHGIEKYQTLINKREVLHDKSARQKIKEVSKHLFSKPWSYRQTIDALILYIDLDTLCDAKFKNTLNSKAHSECKECLFIVKYKNETQINKFEKLSLTHKKNKILYKFIKTPNCISKFLKIRTGAMGLLLLSQHIKIKNYLQTQSLDTTIYIDTTSNGNWWLEKYEYHLQKLTEWQLKDSWLWMIGAMDVVKNNCCFSMKSWHTYNFESFLNSSKSAWFMKDGKITKHLNLPKEIMKKIRPLY